MKQTIVISIFLCSVMALAHRGAAAQGGLVGSPSFNSISAKEIELLLADVAKTNPMALKRLSEDPDAKKGQIDSLRQLLAFASQAKREGLADDPMNRQELENIRAEIIAVNYDREINKDRGKMPPFGFLTETQLAAYWAEKPSHEKEFDDFLNAKIGLLKASSPDMANHQVSSEERTQARDIFAKIRIHAREFEQKARAGVLSQEFLDKVGLQVKLQQAQFLARLYSKKIANRIQATDDEVAKYAAGHPEFDTSVKKAKAQGILKRAQAGEDFAALANEFSEDPGNKGSDGKLQGGLYSDVPMGRMVRPFEATAVALQPGQVAPTLTETDFGYHIIKLEKKAAGKDGAGTYDVRHILISTSYHDPDKPGALDVPLKDYIRGKIEEGKEKQVLDQAIAENHIQVPDDFAIPAVGAIEAPKPAKKTPVRKKRPVKRRG